MKAFKSFMSPGYLFSLVDSSIIFDNLFSAASLEEVFREKFSSVASKGVDRLNGFQYGVKSQEDFVVVSEKISNGKFRFSPFLEILKNKGRDKRPRLIGIPTIRDRVVLYQLNRFLSACYPERVPKNVASTYVREIFSVLKDKDPAETWICSTDIKSFYDSIDRDLLVKMLGERLGSMSALKLVEHALSTPIVPRNSRRNKYKEFMPKTGVQQGLAISNILASIYMQNIDESMAKEGVTYYRYVDDVLMYGAEDEVKRAYVLLHERLASQGLSLHPVGSGKTHVERLSMPFAYLGYTFGWPLLSVRESTTEHFLQSIAAKFSDYVHNKSQRLTKFKYLNDDRIREIFVLELNERIAGAISKNKRYGWIAYFNQINDLSLLHRLDRAIEGMFERLIDFEGKPPLQLKKLRRAYFEMKYSPLDGYVENYDEVKDPAGMLKFLVLRGRVDPMESLTDLQIKDRYERYVNYSLAAMHADEGGVYG